MLIYLIFYIQCFCEGIARWISMDTRFIHYCISLQVGIISFISFSLSTRACTHTKFLVVEKIKFNVVVGFLSNYYSFW